MIKINTFDFIVYDKKNKTPLEEVHILLELGHEFTKTLKKRKYSLFQYIERKDKNENKIYEGHWFKLTNETIGILVYNPKQSCYGLNCYLAKDISEIENKELIRFEPLKHIEKEELEIQGFAFEIVINFRKKIRI